MLVTGTSDPSRLVLVVMFVFLIAKNVHIEILNSFVISHWLILFMTVMQCCR